MRACMHACMHARHNSTCQRGRPARRFNVSKWQIVWSTFIVHTCLAISGTMISTPQWLHNPDSLQALDGPTLADFELLQSGENTCMCACVWAGWRTYDAAVPTYVRTYCRKSASERRVLLYIRTYVNRLRPLRSLVFSPQFLTGG